MSRYEGTIFEGRTGLIVAAVLSVAAVVLTVLQWVLLPDQVVVQFGMDGEHYGSKLVIVVVTAALGLGGAAWLAASRAKTGLLVSAIGLALAVMTIVINLML